MGHFAEVKNDIVQRVIVAEQDFIDSWAVGDPSKWIRTSYNNRIRNVYAGVGFHYIKDKDIFIEPPPFPSWSISEVEIPSLDENNNIIKTKKYAWTAPVPKPIDSDEVPYLWNENDKVWYIDPNWDAELKQFTKTNSLSSV